MVNSQGLGVLLVKRSCLTCLVNSSPSAQPSGVIPPKPRLCLYLLVNSPLLATLRNKSFLWRYCGYVAVKNIQMELLEVVKYSILLPSQNIPQRLAKGIASFLEIFNSPDCTLKKNSVSFKFYSWVSRGQNVGKMRSLLILSLLRESGEQPAHLVQLDVLLRDLVLQPGRVIVDLIC